MQEQRRDQVDARMEALLEFAGAYFMEQSSVHRAAEDLARRLEEAGIDYVIAGAICLGFHGYRRLTEDVDVIVTREGLEKFKAAWLGRGYVNVRPGGKPVRDTHNNVRIDFLIAGEFPGDGNPKPVVIPTPAEASEVGGKFRVLSLTRLLDLKLASGMTAPHRLKDLADVQELIRKASLSRDVVEALNPYVRDKFLELWEAAQQHPDEEY